MLFCSYAVAQLSELSAVNKVSSLHSKLEIPVGIELVSNYWFALFFSVFLTLSFPQSTQ